MESTDKEADDQMVDGYQDEPEPDVIPAALPSADPAVDTTFLVGLWAGQPNYGCPHCYHKSLDQRDVMEHVRVTHPDKES